MADRIVVELDGNAKGLVVTVNGATKAITDFDRQTQASLKNVESNLRRTQGELKKTASTAQAATTTARNSFLAWGRVIQDLPFGFIGIQNNLTELLPAVGGLGIAFSILVSAITFSQTGLSNWTKGMKGAKGETEDMVKALKDYRESISAVNQAQLESRGAAGEDLSRLIVLRRIIEDNTNALSLRTKAIKELRKENPGYFDDLTNEALLAGKASTAYDTLTKQILASAVARKYADKIAEGDLNRVTLEDKINKNQTEGIKNLKQINLLETAIANASYTDKMEGRYDATRDKINELRKANRELYKEQQENYANLAKVIEEDVTLLNQYEKASKRVLETYRSPDKKKKAAALPKPAALPNTDNAVALLGLEGADKELAQKVQEYTKYFDLLIEAAKRKGADLTAIEQARTRLSANLDKELNDIVIRDYERVESEKQRIRTESGIASATDRNKELQQIDKWYALEMAKARDNAGIIEAIEQGKIARIAAVNDKWHKKELEEYEKVYAKINAILDKSFTQNVKQSSDVTARNKKALDERLSDVGTYFDKLKALYKSDPILSYVFGQAKQKATITLNTKFKEAESPGTEIFNSALVDFAKDFNSALATISRGQYKYLENLAFNLSDLLDSQINVIFANQLQATFKNLLDGVKLSSTQVIGSIAGIAGRAIQGLSKATSTAGQGIGGALTGAAGGLLLGAQSGLASGGLIGAGIGAAVGLIAGIFSAKRARKQEEIEKAQLEEQKRQTKLLEIQNALAYTSSIIGRMTNQGIVTGFDVNSSGQLIAKIQGKDILLILDRTAAGQKRGVI